jgi:hypothetical protein
MKIVGGFVRLISPLGSLGESQQRLVVAQIYFEPGVHQSSMWSQRLNRAKPSFITHPPIRLP